MSEKKVVLYSSYLYCVVGDRALVFPINHPSEDMSNGGTLASTSPVIAKDTDGRGFETMNTHYRQAA